MKRKNVYNLRNSSLKLLENRKQQEINKDADVYEFTFDPAEEPPPQKKKKRRVAKKKAEKPKVLVLKNNYEQKVAKSLEVLKNRVINNNTQKQHNELPAIKKCSKDSIPNQKKELSDKANNNNISHVRKNKTNQQKHVSIRIEDIAAQFESTPSHHELDYSPVNTHKRPIMFESTPNRMVSVKKPNNDPLNLCDDMSFFEDEPIANSSMNISKHPTASPWRVEYNNLPIKWKSNTYVKPNMTPAFECSYIENSSRKQVYTNILPESDNPVPETESNNTNLKQTSIISFIRDTVNKSLNKSKNKIAVTPTKQNSLFEDSINTSAAQMVQSPVHFDAPTSDQSKNDSCNSNKSSDKSYDEIITRSRKTKIKDLNEAIKNKAVRKENDITLFGFDDSENVDQENVSPEIIDKRKRRNLRPKSRAVLKELNQLAGPMRAVIPVKMKLGANSEVVNKIYEELKSAEPAPLLPEKVAEKNLQTTNINADSDSDSDSNSVHLFEDIELIHHLKTTRKSYGKAKKVTFHRGSSSDNDDQPPQDDQDDSHDDLSDLTFHIPAAEKKKTGKKKMTKKQKMTKKEEKEAEQWAAQFNSMCEDVEEFDLIVE